MNAGNLTKRKTCFVIMGFGEKMDYNNSREVDLDIIYNRVIKKVFEKDLLGYTLIRSDEIEIAHLIDSSMYAMIMKSDLVIAVISTLNANALYELGIRHAERPFSTIIMMQNSERSFIPFDLRNANILFYDDYNHKLSRKEAKVIRSRLKKFVENTEMSVIDSPVYGALPVEQRPNNIDAQYKHILESFQNPDKNDTVRHKLKQLSICMKTEDFAQAEKIWFELHKIFPEDVYITQKLAFTQYKKMEHVSDKKIKEDALNIALETIMTLGPDKSLDLETLGLTGAIYKRRYQLSGNFNDLKKSLFFYQRGFVIQNDYYTGENYAYCLLAMTKNANSEDEITYLKYEANRVFHTIITTLESEIEAEVVADIDPWKYATLSTSNYCVGNKDKAVQYRKLFFGEVKEDWKRESFLSQLDNLISLL